MDVLLLAVPSVFLLSLIPLFYCIIKRSDDENNDDQTDITRENKVDQFISEYYDHKLDIEDEIQELTKKLQDLENDRGVVNYNLFSYLKEKIIIMCQNENIDLTEIKQLISDYADEDIENRLYRKLSKYIDLTQIHQISNASDGGDSAGAHDEEDEEDDEDDEEEEE